MGGNNKTTFTNFSISERRNNFEKLYNWRRNNIMRKNFQLLRLIMDES